MKVLLVTALPDVSAAVSTALLAEEDVEVLEVRTPQRALALIDEGRRFDVVVGDADTAPTGGFALCREVKARGQMGQDVPPVVLLIARPQDTFLARWAQADAWALKPIDPFDFSEAVRAVVVSAPLPELPGIGGGAVSRMGQIPMARATETEQAQTIDEHGPEDARARPGA